ncbi:hypothetical protein [Mesorhizobium sp.]|uniref:hypothetical protein n=1 Tax=Mesorhizobium sp. TaxID=1871066 RepID=UPI00338EBDD0
MGIVRGWHRSFCLGWDRWFRGSEKWPGLMLALDQGGQSTALSSACQPMVLRRTFSNLPDARSALSRIRFLHAGSMSRRQRVPCAPSLSPLTGSLPAMWAGFRRLRWPMRSP